MSLLPVGVIPSGGYDINNSLRFRSSASASLSRTPTSAGNRTTWTWSGWVKRGLISGAATYGIFEGFSTSTALTSLHFNNDKIRVQDYLSPTYNLTWETSSVFRDPSAWYHILLAYDTTQASSANAVKIYVNGVQQTLTFTAFGGSYLQNRNSFVNATNVQYIGRYSATNYFDGYMAEVNFIDGQALTPSSFGSTNATTGVWQPAKYTGTYGTNGFYLPFKDASGTSQNFALSSEDFSNGTYWDKTTYPCTVTANSTTAPDGTTTADTVLGNNGAASLIFQNIPTATSGTGALTASIYAKAGTGSTFTLNVYYSSDSEVNIGFNLSNGTCDAGGTITSVGDGWYRCSLQVPARVGAGTTVLYRIWPNPRGDSTNRSIYVWGAQLNSGTTVCPYYVTTTAAQTSINNLGVDYSVTTGGYNNFIPNNISVTSGATYDAMTDSPTLTSPTVGNYCVLNNIALIGTATTNGSTSNANLTATTATSSGSGVGATMAVNMPSGNKWYWEVTLVSGVTTAASACQLGVCENSAPDGIIGTSYGYNSSDSPTYTNGDTISFAYDGAASILYCYKNNVLAKTVTSVSSNAPLIPAIRDNLAGGAIVAHFNFGQRPFTYTPPAGYVRLNTFNLPDSTIKKGNSYMDATTYTGNGASPRSITNAASFRPDFVWIKDRTSGTIWHILSDSNRGANRNLFSNSTNAEAVSDANGWLSAFNSNGFSIVTGTTITNVNANGDNYVAWQWQAGSSTVTNTSGTISAQVRANTTTGFSIVTYTGTGANATVGHGLGVAPKMIIVKDRSDSQGWAVYHSSLANTQFLLLNSTAAAATGATYWNSTSPTSTVFSIGTIQAVNKNTDSFVAYCWAEIAGFSRFGSYTGNGSTEGTFVYLGFRPKFVIVKNASVASDWVIIDSSRNTFNVASSILQPNLSNAEGAGTSTNSIMDLLSNGFKMRGTGGSGNGNGNTIIYAAFAENPFKNALAR